MKTKVFNERRKIRFKRFVRKAYGAFNSMHKVINIGVVAACTLTFANSTRAQGQSVATNHRTEGEMLEQELEEVTVTASRTEIPLSQTAKLVTVITRDDIARAPIQSIEDLLNYAANIDVVQRGGHGVQADISIRGGSADQTAVLLNGVNISNPHTGHYSFDIPINLSDIERIEILHGPSALVYGSSAFSGGINIITKKEPDARIAAKLKAGMHALADAEIRGATQAGIANLSLSTGYRRSDGYIANSDYDIYNVLFQTNIKPKKINIMAGYNNKSYGANTFYSALYPNQYERTSEILGAVSGMFGQKLKFIPQIYWTRHFDRFDLIKNTDTGRNYHRGDTYGANMMFLYTSTLGNTHFGGEMRREDIMSSKLGKPLASPHGRYTNYDGRTLTNIVIEHTLNLHRFTFSAGALANYNTLQGDKLRFYPSASMAYRPAEGLKINASWSRSSRLPTFTDLYYTTETHTANETLRPETSESFDLGVTYKRGYFEASLTGYIMNGRNMIDWVREASDEKWASWNHTEVDKRGVEAQVRTLLWYIMPFMGQTSTFAVSYAHITQSCDSKGLESRYTLNYLRDKLTAGLNHNILKGLTASWNFRFQDRTGSFRLYENGIDKGLHDYPPFSTLDLRLIYNLKKVNINLDFNNIFNEQYYDIGNVPQAGFWLIAGLEWIF
ncbi:MAG: TonB-dependent receptor [Tannerella sp.]|jgi:iron complex outermembrane receptor protein|nr:TonB-dependent receptor [Tannerella sp.]